MLPIYVELIQKLGSQFDDLEFVIHSPQAVFSYLQRKIAKYKLNVKILSESEMSVEEFNLLKLSLFQLSLIAINTFYFDWYQAPEITGLEADFLIFSLLRLTSNYPS